ncbi:PREDICTED: protocadherin alpha-3-like [Ficedula albicollis]|uniref:protocadherin alpha-3-like n=1 Tax=Ficedula albicollis TaxID=59894 RepID=UPI0007AD7B9B|nr:PREDICTED: protocadherin alpha-3-like [Ficedula albicollis]
MRWGAVLQLLVLQAAWALAGGQVRYSVPEEAKAGTVVGRLAQDLGLEAGEAEARRLRLVAQGRRASVEVSGASGALLVSSRLDREELCGKSAPCALRLEVLLERPLRVFHVQLEVTDINDNAPVFPAARGIPMHRLVLTASDGGRPSLTGTMELVISVLDANDNAPQFNQSLYKVQLSENASVGTLVARMNATDAEEGTVVARMNATDPDEGSNKEFSYSILSSIPIGKKELFTIDAKTGEIRLTGTLDFEDVRLHELQIEATDKGTPPLSGHCKVDKALEGSERGTLLITLSASDPDEGINSDITYLFSRRVSTNVKDMFTIDENTGEIRLQGKLDYEEIDSYEIPVEARDKGSPPLSGHCSVELQVLDVNDNAPNRAEVKMSQEDSEHDTPGKKGIPKCSRERNDNAPSFAQAVYTVLARENNAAGAELARLWARDPDEAGNGRVSYSLWEGGAGGGGAAPPSGWGAASSYVALDAESGRLWALQPLDYEQLQVLQFEVRAVDAGEPPLCGNATVQLFVLDENDNAPALLPPAGSAAEAGAVAAEAAAGGGPRHRLLIVVRDHGEPARSATATLSVSLLEPAEAALAAAAGSSAASGSRSAAPVELGAAAAAAATNVWLVVAICAVSSLFLLALVLYGASRWAPRAAVLSAPGPTTLVCASEVGSWSYSQRHSRSLCVADGAPKSDLMVFSPNFPPPPPGAAPKDTQPEPSALLDTVSDTAFPRCLLCSFSSSPWVAAV